MLVYSLPTWRLFCCKKPNGIGNGHQCVAVSGSRPRITHLLRLHPLRERFDVILHRHVNEFVLCLRLDHAGTLSSDGLDHALDVDLAVQT